MTARRASALAMALFAGASCASAAAPRSRAHLPTAVAVAAQPCETPNRRSGLGVLVGDGLVLTAAHVVDGRVRVVTIDGRAGRVVAVDARLDAALVAIDRDDVETGVEVVELAAAPESVATVSIVGAAGAVRARVVRRVDLSVHDTTSRSEHRRRSIVLGTDVPHGTSGAPVVDAAGRVVAMVALTDTDDGETYATDAAELLGFVRAHDDGDVATLDPPEVCS